MFLGSQVQDAEVAMIQRPRWVESFAGSFLSQSLGSQ